MGVSAVPVRMEGINVLLPGISKPLEREVDGKKKMTGGSYRSL